VLAKVFDYEGVIRAYLGLIRNLDAHRPKITFPISDADAPDIMVVISLIHKKLDTAI
jgi:hypothetical protein